MSPQIAWLALVTAGLLDVGWAIAMKNAEGYTRLGWSIASLVLLAAFVLAPQVDSPYLTSSTSFNPPPCEVKV